MSAGMVLQLVISTCFQLIFHLDFYTCISHSLLGTESQQHKSRLGLELELAMMITYRRSRAICSRVVSQLDTCFEEHHWHGPSRLQVIVTWTVVCTPRRRRRRCCCWCWSHARSCRQGNRLADHAVNAMLQAPPARCPVINNTATDKRNGHKKINRNVELRLRVKFSKRN